MKSSIPLFKTYLSSSISESVKQVLESGFVGQGPKVEEFEGLLKHYIGCDYLVTTNSATSALHLALRMNDIGSNRNIITTPFSFYATAWTILLNNIHIKWADIDPYTCNISAESIKDRINAETAAILLVHWGGYPCDMDEILEISRYYNIPIIEDAAPAFGSIYKGKKIGSFNTFTAFSFQATKTQNAIDGGALCVPSVDLEHRAKLLRWFGVDREAKQQADFRLTTDVREIGDKLHMNDINAAIGIENLKHLDLNLARQQENATYYNRALIDVDGIKLLQQGNDRQSTYWSYPIRAQNRDGLQSYLKEKNVASSRVHHRLDNFSCVSQYRVDLPNLDVLYNEILCIPVGWWVGREEREYIVSLIKQGW